MAEVYVTLGEAAELERVKYNTMVKRVLRKQESFVTKTEKSENGGKDVVLVAVSSLSKQARNAWKEREKLKSFTEEFPDKKEDEQKPEVPWYVNTDVDWYIENYKERYYKAVELGNVVRKFLQYDEGDRTKYAEEFAQKYLGKGQRSKTTTTKETYTSERWGKEGGTTIHQISFTVDISKIKDLPLLYKLIDELKDAQNRTDSPTPATT